MAIKFVDIEPEDGPGKPKKAVGIKPAKDDAEPLGDAEARLPLAKPEPKPRGRKKPLK